MNYITVEQFMGLSEEIRKVFIDWWQPKMHDLFLAKLGEIGDLKCCIGDKYTLEQITQNKGVNKFPLFRLDQLWEFISTRYKHIGVNNYSPTIEHYEWNVKLFKSMKQLEPDIEVTEKDLLQAFWEAAVLVAKEKVRG